MSAAAPQAPARPGGGVILCADDFAISEGVSRGIEVLAATDRLSATSALVTLPIWQSLAPRLVALRPKLAIGLHLNMTLGVPLAPMPSLAPAGKLPAIGEVIKRAVTGRIDIAEVSAEIGRQLAAFEAAAGCAPDFVDGHQHVHALPGIRTALLDVLERRFPNGGLLIRDPADSTSAILARGAATAKALTLATLAAGFGKAARAAGFVTNAGFSGVSPFDETKPYADELHRFFSRPGPCHLVMCHPGYPDGELARLDPVLGRRLQELDTLMSAPGLPEAIWHIDRHTSDPWPRWPDASAATKAEQHRP